MSTGELWGSDRGQKVQDGAKSLWGCAGCVLGALGRALSLLVEQPSLTSRWSLGIGSSSKRWPFLSAVLFVAGACASVKKAEFAASSMAWHSAQTRLVSGTGEVWLHNSKPATGQRSSWLYLCWDRFMSVRL